MKLTKHEAIRKHRHMWLWIAWNSLKQRRCITKKEYLVKHGFEYVCLDNNCFLCEYTSCVNRDCSGCPIDWKITESCIRNTGEQSSFFERWLDACETDDYEQAAKMAYTISKLPEKEN